MIDKTPYTPGMREVLKLSKAEAGRLGHDYIGPEHYLLAIIRKGDGLAVETLSNLDIDLEEVRMEIEQMIELGKAPTIGLYQLSTEAKAALEAAKQAANSLKHGWVGTEHLLIGLITQEDTIPSKCLRQFGLDVEKVRREVMNAIEGSKTHKLPETASSSIEEGHEWAVEAIQKLMESMRPGNWDSGLILLSIVKDENSVAAKILKPFGLDYAKVQEEYRKLAEPETKNDPGKE